jgi:hypothetical protein
MLPIVPLRNIAMETAGFICAPETLPSKRTIRAITPPISRAFPDIRHVIANKKVPKNSPTRGKLSILVNQRSYSTIFFRGCSTS